MLQWYEFLSSARGIQSSDDVHRLTDYYAPGYQRLLSRVLPVDRHAPIYDAARSPGLTMNILRRLGYCNLEGTDLSATAIAIAKKLDLSAIQANSIEDLCSRQDGIFSRIFGVDFIEHLEKPNLIRFLQTARTKLRNQDGVLILWCPNGDSPVVGRHLFNDMTHVWTYTSIAITGVLRMSGFNRITFIDETQAFFMNKRWLKVPIHKLSSTCARLMIKAATWENIEILAPSFWIVAATDCQ
jgi:hypothetical protein